MTPDYSSATFTADGLMFLCEERTVILAPKHYTGSNPVTALKSAWPTVRKVVEAAAKRNPGPLNLRIN